MVVWSDTSIGVYRLLGGARSWWESGSIQEGSADKFSPELVMPVSQSQQGATAAPCLHRRPSNTSRPGLSRDNRLLPWVLVCSRPCVWSPNVGFLFPLVLWDSWGQTPYPSKPDSGGSSSYCQTPRLGSLMVGFEIFHVVGELLWYNYSPVCNLRGIWFYCDCAPPTGLLWLLLCLWMQDFFGRFQHFLLLLMAVLELVVVLVFF